MKRVWVLGGILSLALLFIVTAARPAAADRATSTNFVLDSSVMNNFGGSPTSTNYKMVSSGGEPIIGNGSGGSYKIVQGYTSPETAGTQAMQLAVQPSNLLTYYTYDEGAGPTVYNNVTDENHGTTFNSPTWTTSGKIGGGMVFDGVDDKVEVPTTSTPVETMSTTTWSAWVYPTNVSKDQMFVTGSTTSNYLRITTSKAFVSLNIGGTQRTRLGTTTLLNNQWYHIAATYDGSALRLYVNGVEENILNGLSGALTTSAGHTIYMGQWIEADKRSFVGTLDEVKIYNRALNDREIKAEYAAQNAGVPAGVALGAVTPGTSNTATFDAIMEVDTTYYGYNLMVNQDHNLQSGANTISPVSGSIASPVAWSEGTTKGLGFTLYGTNATAIPGTWNSGNSYAAFPGSSTTFYSRTLGNELVRDTLNMRLRLDTTTTQASGDYSNTITVTGAIVP